MRLLFVSPRYGADVSGGAEVAVREMGQRLRGRGHEVHVLTTCSRSYVEWDDDYPAGDGTVDGMPVHRFPVDKTPIDSSEPGSGPVMDYRQRTPWQLPGYPVPGAARWLQRNSGDFDVVIPYTYQHHTTWDAAMLSRAPVLLHPTAHPEPLLNASLFDLMFRRVAMVSLHTPEERDLVRWRFGLEDSRLAVPGIGVAPLTATEAEVRAFRDSHGLQDLPYVVCVGRTDTAKGAPELVRQFIAMKARRPDDLRLVVVGEEVARLPVHPDVIVTGFVPDATRNAAVAGAEVLVQPSTLESFSFVIAEAWLLGVPVIARGRSAVLSGQVARSGGGLTYEGETDLETKLHHLLASPDLRQSMARAGARYLALHSDWEGFLDRYEHLLGEVAGGRRRAGAPAAPDAR